MSRLALSGLVFLLALVPASTGLAQTIFVNSVLDEEDMNLSDGICETASGTCTLRAAMQHAQAVGGAWTIVLGGGYYALSISGGGENTCVAGDLDIFAAHLTIQGAGSGTTTIDASGLDRIFDVQNGFSFSLEGVRLTGGDPGSGSPPGTVSQNGGALRIGAFGSSPSTVILTDVVIESNQATLPGPTESDGGGIWNNGHLSLTNVMLRSNHCDGDGAGILATGASTTSLDQVLVELNTTDEQAGGISNSGSMTMMDSVVRQNVAQGSGGGIRNGGSLDVGSSLIELNTGGAGPGLSFGGGINCSGGLTLIDSTIEGNAIGGAGGGINITGTGSVDVQRSTINGNLCDTDGAGIQNLGTLTMTNATVSGNTALGLGGGLANHIIGVSVLQNVTVADNDATSGGGISNDVISVGSCHLRNSILADNTSQNFAGPTALAISGIILDTDGSVGLSAPHLSGVSALLGPLAANGGATRTHALLAGSPAIDAGLPVGCDTPGVGPLLEDQRAFPRAEDGDGDGITICDLGSFEAPSAPPPGGCVPGAWNLVVPSPGAPAPRLDHRMAYDSDRDVVVLHGGQAIPLPTGTWEYDGTWQLASTSGPGTRWSHGMAFDSSRNVTVLFGGHDGSFISNETWEWDGTNWTLRALPTSPSPRLRFVMDYDSQRGVVVLFGGHDGFGTFFNETWEYNGTTWTQRFPSSSPSPRDSAAMAYDSSRGVCVLNGGGMGSVQEDTWEWDGTNWHLRELLSPPGFRASHAMAYDPQTQRTLLFGGPFSGDETWAWDGNSWTQITAPGAGPGGRSNLDMVFDAGRGVAVLYGGNSTATFDDTWELGCASAPVQRFIRGDCDASGAPGITDVISYLNYLFVPASTAPICLDACDVNDDDVLTLPDGVLNLQFQFIPGAPPPASPFPGCGPDPTPGSLTCLAFPPCP